MKHFHLFLSFLTCVAGIAGSVSAQQDPVYPAGYFRNPLGIPIVLAGNFGECRPGHFHSGIDIKTQGRENLPVYAAAEGYVSRMKTEPGGFGHALYVTHPNGYTTVYAHLNDFAAPLQRHLREQQYLLENWQADIILPPGKFPVKKGDQIAWSGNTGGSTAPHLHFEIRDTRTERPLNAQLFGFPYADRQPPVPLKLAVYRSPGREIYRTTPALFPLRRKEQVYTPASGDTIVVRHTDPATGIGIEVNDFMDGSTNTLAYYTAELYLDEQLQCRVLLDEIGYDETRYLHAYADYKTRQEKQLWIQCMFRLPGNRLDRIYRYLNDEQGVLQLTAGKAHRLKLVVTDVAGNRSTVQCHILQPQVAAEIQPDCPDLLRTGQAGRVTTASLDYTLDSAVLYTDICPVPDRRTEVRGYSALHRVLDPGIPAHRYFDLKIRPDRPVPFALRDKIVMLYRERDGGKETGRAATADENGWYRARVRGFGSYRLDIDTVPPRISPVNGKTNVLTTAKEIRFRVSEELTSVAYFRAELNGKWLLFEQAGHHFFYRFDERCPKGKHTLRIVARDEQGNEAVLVYPFTR